MARNPDSNLIIGAIITALGSMTTGGGYNYTQDSDYVFDWIQEGSIDPEDETTVIDIKDLRNSQERPEGSNYYLNIQEVQITIAKSGKNDANVRTIIRKTKQDVLQCMMTDAKTQIKAAGIQIEDIDYRGGEPEFDREKKLLGGTVEVFDVYYKTNRGQI